MSTLLTQIALGWSVDGEQGYCPVQRTTVPVATCQSCEFVQHASLPHALGPTGRLTCRPTFSALASDRGAFLA